MTPEGDMRAFVWNAGNLTFLPAPTPGGGTRGFVTSGGVSQDTGTLYGGDTVAWGVNASGQAVGKSLAATGDARAFLYSGGAITDIGTLGGSYAQARDINNPGVIVGGSQPGPAFPDDGSHAFMYRDGVMSDLGTLCGGFSFANAVNEAGLVVGLASLPGFGFSHAFLYADGQLLDLNALVEGGLGDFTLTEAAGINGAGQIIANGCNDFGFCAPCIANKHYAKSAWLTWPRQIWRKEWQQRTPATHMQSNT